jgi:hypothetical protein
MYTDEKPLWETEKAPVRLLEIEKGYQLDAGQLEKRRRTCESQTSIDKLIQFPFDYVSGYLAGFWEVKDGELADLKTTEGLVAHRYIEKLFEEGREEMVAFYEKLSDEERKQRITSAICEKGAILLLSEYKMELHRFYTCLDSSVSELMKIIARLNLVPTGCEVELDVDLEGIGTFGGSVDMMLKNERGEWVIFDFKWSTSSNNEKKLEENKSIQLCLYKKLIEQETGKKVKLVAYYLLPLSKFVSVQELKGEINFSQVIVNYERASKDLLKEIQGSYKYRIKELSEGKLEETTGFEEQDIEYEQVREEFELLPMDYYENKKSGSYQDIGLIKERKSGE